MIDWSYDHLPSDEQALLRNLSVLSGSSSLGAIQALSGEADDVVGGEDQIFAKQKSAPALIARRVLTAVIDFGQIQLVHVCAYL